MYIFWGFWYCFPSLHSSLLPSSPSLLFCPLHLDSLSVRGVTGVSRLSPSLSQLVDLCLIDYCAHRSLLASSDWQDCLACHPSSQLKSEIELWARVRGQVHIYICVCVYVCVQLLDFFVLLVYPCREKVEERQGSDESGKSEGDQKL